MKIRRYERSDTKEVLSLFQETVLSINARDYTKKQVDIWAHSFSDEELLEKRLTNTVTYIALYDDRIVGFGNYNSQSEIDLLYVHKDYQNQGIASILLAKLEQTAVEAGMTVLKTEASITAKPFFERKGYSIVEKQVKGIKNTDFLNFVMCKSL